MYRCEVRIDGMVAASWGSCDSVFAAMNELASSPYAVATPSADFVVVRIENDEVICEADAKGLLVLFEMERERQALQ